MASTHSLYYGIFPSFNADFSCFTATALLCNMHFLTSFSWAFWSRGNNTRPCSVELIIAVLLCVSVRSWLCWIVYGCPHHGHLQWEAGLWCLLGIQWVEQGMVDQQRRLKRVHLKRQNLLASATERDSELHSEWKPTLWDRVQKVQTHTDRIF